MNSKYRTNREILNTISNNYSSRSNKSDIKNNSYNCTVSGNIIKIQGKCGFLKNDNIALYNCGDDYPYQIPTNIPALSNNAIDSKKYNYTYVFCYFLSNGSYVAVENSIDINEKLSENNKIQISFENSKPIFFGADYCAVFRYSKNNCIQRGWLHFITDGNNFPEIIINNNIRRDIFEDDGRDSIQIKIPDPIANTKIKAWKFHKIIDTQYQINNDITILISCDEISKNNFNTLLFYNDTKNIQELIDNVAAKSVDKNIILGNGHDIFQIFQSIIIPSNVNITLNCTIRWAPIVLLSCDKDGTDIFKINNSNSIKIRSDTNHIHFDMFNCVGSGDAIYCENANNIIIENINFDNAYHTALSFINQSKSSKLIINNCTFASSSTNIIITNYDNISIKNNIFNNIGITLENISNGIISENQISKYDNGKCIEVISSNNCLIDRNIIQDCEESVAIFLINSSNIFCNHNILKNLLHGIVADTINNCSISENNLFNIPNKDGLALDITSNNYIYNINNIVTKNNFYCDRKNDSTSTIISFGGGINNIFSSNIIRTVSSCIMAFDEESDVMKYKNNIISYNILSGCKFIFDKISNKYENVFVNNII